MFLLEQPELKLHLVELESDMPITKGSATTPDRLVGRISLGEPRSMLVTTKLVGKDKVLRNFMHANAKTLNFYLVHMACTFYPLEDEPFERAWLNINLVNEVGAGLPRPITWSMQPSRLVKNVEFSSTIKLGGALKFMDSGIEVNEEREKTQTEEEVFLQAFGEQESEPFWEFQATSLAEIRGLYRFTMIVQVPKGSKAQGFVSLRALIKRKKFGIISYRTDFSAAPKTIIYFS